MSRTLRRMLAGFLAALCLSGSAACAFAASAVSASACVLMDADSGRVLFAREETRERAIASITKIMTAVVVLEHADPSARVTVKREHLKEGSSMYLQEGEELTVEALLYGLMLPSGNDAAECLAEACGGSTARFVGWMNQKAAQLGMTHTAFANPSGLDEAGHYSCALDMARLAAYAMRDPAIVRLASTTGVTIGERTMTNHNRLLGTLDGCLGLKTGYTGQAGRTLVTCAERDGLRLVAVTLNDGSDWQDHTALYDEAFAAYRRADAVRRGAVCASVAVRGGAAVSVDAVAAAGFACAAADGEELTVRAECAEEVAAPVAEGQRLGELVILLDGRELGRVDLVAGDAVAAAREAAREGFAARLWRFLIGQTERRSES